MFFVPYAVDNDRFMAAAKELRIRNQELRKRLNIEREAVVILFVGKLIEKKDRWIYCAPITKPQFIILNP